MQYQTALVLLDEPADWGENAKVIVSWSENDVPQNQISLSRKVEESAEQIKREYLAWVYELGQFKIRNKSIIAKLKILKNFSFWWMTLIAEKSIYRCPAIYKVFKLRALEKIYLEQNCHGLIYCGHDLSLHRILEQWCKTLGNPYKRQPTKAFDQNTKISGIKKWAPFFPFAIQAVAHLICKWFSIYRHIKRNEFSSEREWEGDNQATIVTYFPNIDIDKTKNGRFWSHYWEDLHELLDKLPLKVNWIWMYSDSNKVEFKEAVRLRDICNQKQPNKYRHYLLEDFLTSEAFFKALKIYIKVYLRGILIKGARRAFHFPGSKLNFFPIMEHEWKASLFGHFALNGAMNISIFSSMAEKLPSMPWCMFLLENQPWELALIATWKKHQEDSKTIGFQHTPGIRPLDLRLFFDPKVFSDTTSESPPLPDIFAIHCPFGKELLQEYGYPNDKFFNVEGLRSLNLLKHSEKNHKKLKSSDRTLLVLTGFIMRETAFQLSILKNAAVSGGLNSYSKIIIKPHPDLTIKPILEEIQPDFNYQVTHEPISELWPDADVIYCANSSTACLEAAWLGFPLIISGPIDDMNLNPLFGLPGIRFMENGSMLLDELTNPSSLKLPEAYFHLNKNLNQWKELLESSFSTNN